MADLAGFSPKALSHLIRREIERADSVSSIGDDLLPLSSRQRLAGAALLAAAIAQFLAGPNLPTFSSQ